MIRSIDALTRVLNVLAAMWLMLLTVVILVDVVGRFGFNSPLPGAREIVGNSVVAILFLQIPLAVLRGGMIRTTFVYDLVGPNGKRIIDGLTFILGIAFFVAVGVGGWPDMIMGWRVREFEGIGALEIPVYPVRTIAVFLSFLAAIVYLLLLIGVALPKKEPPGAAS